MSNGYEPGMKVTYAPHTRTVVVNFRGRVTVLPGTYDTEGEGVRAGEGFCRQQGWRPAPPRPASRAPFRSAW
jgi:hypothetical protein